MVVVAGFGEKSLVLLTNLVSRARDSEALWRIVEIYLTKWKIEETFRFLKQSYNLEDLRFFGLSALTESGGAGGGCNPLRRCLPGTETQAVTAHRKTHHHLPALLWHPAVPVLRARRWHPQRALPLRILGLYNCS